MARSRRPVLSRTPDSPARAAALPSHTSAGPAALDVGFVTEASRPGLIGCRVQVLAPEKVETATQWQEVPDDEAAWPLPSR